MPPTILFQVFTCTGIISGAQTKRLSRSFNSRAPCISRPPAETSGYSFLRDNFDYAEIRHNQPYSLSGKRRGFEDARGTLFFEIARLAQARRPAFLCLENVPGLLSHDQGRTFYAILTTLHELGYGLEWAVLNSANFHIPQSRRRLFLVGYLDPRCSGNVFPLGGNDGKALIQLIGGPQGYRVYDPSGVACTQTSGSGVLMFKDATKRSYKEAYPGDTVKLGYTGTNRQRGRVGHDIAHTLTTARVQGLVERGGRIRRLMPRECLRLQGFDKGQIDRLLAITSGAQACKQAGNSVCLMKVIMLMYSS